MKRKILNGPPAYLLLTVKCKCFGGEILILFTQSLNVSLYLIVSTLLVVLKLSVDSLLVKALKSDVNKSV